MIRNSSVAGFAAALIATALLAATVIPVVHAEPSKAQATARATIMKLVPKGTIDAVEIAPFPGFQQVVLGGQIVYVSDDGQYVLQGKMFDTASKTNLAEGRLAKDRVAKLAAFPASKHVVFAPANPKYKVTVFTDIDCGYCRRLHSQIADYNKEGIEVDYLFFPRTGLNSPSYDKAVSVWCAKDRNAAFTSAKAGTDPVAAKCDNPVADEFALGQQVGVDGTPTIIASDGTKIGGYLPPDEMLKRLQSLDAASTGKTSG